MPKQQTTQFIYMAMGVNAHVNNDLAFTLLDIVQEESFHQDFEKVNDLIRQSLYQVVLALEENSGIVTFGMHKLLMFYIPILDSLIKNWRTNAWNNYTRLKYGIIFHHHIEMKAYSIALALSEIKRIERLYQLKKVII